MEAALLRCVNEMHSFLAKGCSISLGSERLARTAYALDSKDLNQSNYIKTASYMLMYQQPDGGWVDVEETAWCVAFLKAFIDSNEQIREHYSIGLDWLKAQKKDGQGWGRNSRDKARIPYTSWVGILVPEVISKHNLHWLEEECLKELAHDPCLTYKIALPLLAFDKTNHSIFQTNLSMMVDFLVDSQNEDGGYAPWKGHPCGSDPWCTGISVLGLLTRTDMVPAKVLQKASKWLIDTQLPNGTWPYHYIDEGTAIAYWALRELLIWQGA